MKAEEISFYSDGNKLQGTLYQPEESQPSAAQLVVACSGYTGLNAIYPRLFAQGLTPHGFTVMGFDYRGQGQSDGPPQRIIIAEQISDILSALHFARQVAAPAGCTVSLLGWGMAAGMVCAAAAAADEADWVAGLNGWYDGAGFYRFAYSEAELRELKRRVAEDYSATLRGEESALVDAFEVYPLDPATREVVDARLRPVSGYSTQVRLEFARSVALHDAIAIAHKLRCPAFFAHGEHNLLHPLEQTEAIYRRAPEPKELLLIEGKHNDFMQPDHPEFLRLCGRLVEWAKETAPRRNS